MAVSRIQLPERKRNYRFALTPLADAMFQLLVFFMLTSSLTPYSLLTVQSAPGAAGPQDSAPGDAAATDQPQEAVPPGEVNLWTLEAEAIVVGGQRFTFDALPALADALGASGGPASVVLIVRPSARVQDVTTVLSQLHLARVDQVQVTTGGL